MAFAGVERDYEVKDFEKDVIAASYEVPVVVDFWAPWCGPCRILGPVLEQLAEESGGRWKLVKVNTDRHPDLAQQFHIRGIPSVKLFRNGQVVDEFTGALPRPAIKQWLARHIPQEGEEKLAEASRWLMEGRVDKAREVLEALVSDQPGHTDARLMLAELLLWEDPDAAEAHLKAASPEHVAQMDRKESLETLLRLRRLAEAPENLPEAPVKDIYLKAIEALQAGDLEEAIRRFIEVIQKDRYYDDDGARKAVVALFRLLGEDHPITRKYRRIFDMSLYV